MRERVKDYRNGLKGEISLKKIFRFVLISFCILVLWAAYRLWQPYRKDKAVESAEALYELFIPYVFDGYDIDETDQSVILYEYMLPSEDSSILIRQEVTRIELSSKERKHLSRFKDIRSMHNGLFYATWVTMDGEWKGVFMTESAFPSELTKYPHEVLEPGKLWFDLFSEYRAQYGYQRARGY